MIDRKKARIRGLRYYYRHHEKCLEAAREYSKTPRGQANVRRRHRRWIMKPENRIKAKAAQREWRMRINKQFQQEMVEAYGGKCTCCGETHPKFLTLEHLKGGGHKDRRGGAYVLLRRLKRLGWPKDNYTVLCFNCNCGKYRNKGTCPHKESK